MNIGKIERYQ